MIMDRVKCSWCEYDGMVEIGKETCPKCGKTGFLAWVDGEEQEVEIVKGEENFSC